jgi:hypothetical protein
MLQTRSETQITKLMMRGLRLHQNTSQTANTEITKMVMASSGCLPNLNLLGVNLSSTMVVMSVHLF